MTPFYFFIITCAALFGSMAVTLLWLFRTAVMPMWLKVGMGAVLGALVCWTPLSASRMLGYPQPYLIRNLPKTFRLLQMNAADDKTFDLWIMSPGMTQPLAVEVLAPEGSSMRTVLREAASKLSSGEQPTLSSEPPSDASGKPGDGKTGGSQKLTGNVRTNLGDDQNYELVAPSGDFSKP